MKLKDVKYQDLNPLQRALYLQAKRTYWDRDPDSNIIHVTSLFTPPRQYFLRKRHGKEIWESLTLRDLDNFYWMFSGTIMHQFFASFHIKHTWQDVKVLKLKIKDYWIVGRPDLYYLRKRWLIDYKLTSIYALTHIVDDYKYQLNSYRLMLWLHGHSVKKMMLEVILKDWFGTKARIDKNYPQSFHLTLPVPMIDLKTMYQKIYNRVLIFDICKNLKDSQLPLCTPEERWSKPDMWAVYDRKGKARANRVFYDKKAALEYAKQFKNGYVEYRKGIDKKCDMCDVKHFCNYWRKHYAKKT